MGTIFRCSLAIMVIVVWPVSLVRGQDLFFSSVGSLGGPGVDRQGDVATDAVGNVYVAGSNEDGIVVEDLISTGGEGVFVARRSPTGEWLWLKSFIGCTAALSIELDHTGGVFVTGMQGEDQTVYDGVPVGSLGHSGLFVAKLDTNGNFEWIAETSGIYTGTGGLVVDVDGSIYVGGEHNCALETVQFGDIELPTYGIDDTFLAKLSPQGQWQWARDLHAVNDPGCYPEAPSLLFGDIALGGEAGGVILGGRYSGYHANVGTLLHSTQAYPCENFYTMYLVRYGPDGSFLWARTADPDVAGTSSVQAILPMGPDGQPFTVLIEFGDTLRLDGFTNTAYWATCKTVIDDDGTWLAASTVQDYVAYGGIRDATLHPDGNIYAVSTLNGNLTLGGMEFTSNGGSDALLARISPAGICTGVLQAGGTGDEWPGGVHAIPNALVWFGSYETSMNMAGEELSSVGERDLFITEVGSGSTGLARLDGAQRPLHAAPNPTCDRTVVQVPDTALGNELTVCDAWGRVVYRTAVRFPAVVVDMSGNAAGLYIVRVNGGSVGVFKE